MNANQLTAAPAEQTPSIALPQWMQAVLTAACSVGLTLAIWVLLVSLLARPLRGSDQLVWSGTLWFSAMLSTGCVAYSRRVVQPVLACTIAFGAFGLAYMACEGPIFGAVSEPWYSCAITKPSSHLPEVHQYGEHQSQMRTARQPMKQLAVVFICAAALAGGVANHSGLLRGIIAGAIVMLAANILPAA